MNGQLYLERGFITERLTDDQISDFDDAVELYKDGCPAMSDAIVATLDRELWKQIWRFRESVAEGDFP